MKKSKILFRVNASNFIGTGHIRRCITIAKAARKLNIEPFFAINKNKSNHKYLLNDEKINFYEIEEQLDLENDSKETLKIIQNLNADILVIDSYAIESKWERYISTNSNIKLVVIDDLANRKHYCDLLIDQSFLREKGDYFPLMEKDAQIFCGSQYAMLREEFSKARAISLKKREKFELKRILINFGGTDPNNVTLSLVKKLSEMPEAKYKFSILVGINYKEKKALDNSVNSLPNFKVVTNPKSVSNLLLNTDLVIGAGGTSAWERCCLGIPSFLLKIADNQTFILEKFSSLSHPISRYFL